MYIFEAANPDAAGGPSQVKSGDTPAMEAFQNHNKNNAGEIPFYPLGGKTGEAPVPLDPALLEAPAVREVAALYDAIHDQLEAGTNHPGWWRSVYPTAGIAAIAYGKGTLYLLRTEGGELAGTVVLNQEPEAAYAGAEWGAELANEEILVVHTLVVHPAHQGKGAARALMAHAEELARGRNLKAVRLDTWENNEPGKALYEGCGYTFRGQADFGLGGMGLHRFNLYEKLL